MCHRVITRPSTQTRFYRTSREAYGAFFPAPGSQPNPDWPVAAACVLGAVLLILGVIV